MTPAIEASSLNQWTAREVPIVHLHLKMLIWGNSLASRWLRLYPSTAGIEGSIPGQGAKIPHAIQPKK